MGVVLATLTDTRGIIAIVAAAVAVLALLFCALLAMSVRRLRATQKIVLGADGERDVVTHAADLEVAFDALRDYVGDIAERLDLRLAEAEQALRGAVAHRALIRYDAYNEMSGRQSMSIALLDDTRSGIVLSSIHHRDQARLYAKQVHDGMSELELSPEESEAMRQALTGSAPDAPATGDARAR